MALRLTRAVDSRLFGGFHLDSADLKGTSDHIVWVRKVNITPEHQYAVFNVWSQDHTREFSLDVRESFSLGKEVTIWLEACDEYPMVIPERCFVCGAQRKRPQKVRIAQAKIGVDAPREYTIIRDDARKR
tara:strand:- start:161 stop:550 length:390 start_codon:yes stop_codon:yes gene_type:complete